MTLIGVSIVILVVLIAMCARSFSTAEYVQHDQWAMALGLFTLGTSLALGIGSALFLRTYEAEPYYGSFYVPVLTCAGAILVSLVGLIIGAVLSFEAWRAARR